MKIVFVIACINSKSNGLGGHYFSLLETVDQIAASHDVVIVNVGNQRAKALENSKFKTYTVVHPGAALIKTGNQLNKIIKSEKPDVLHAFDSLAFYWVRKAGYKNKIPFCLTKCGGTNPIYYPHCDDLILFSRENLEYFKSSVKFAGSNFYFIPNRIIGFEDDVNRIADITNQLGPFQNSFKFLRIARIGKYYHSSSLQLIELVNKLSNDGFDCCALIIGTVEDEVYQNELKLKGGKNVFFFTEDQYAKNAKAEINCADAVLGTGRSFMEASSKSKILLCPIKESAIPLLVSAENFDQIFYYNFSERIGIDSYSESENYEKIKIALHDEKIATELKEFSFQCYEEFFDANKIGQKYEEVYFNLKPARFKYFDFLLHTLFLIRNYYR